MLIFFNSSISFEKESKYQLLAEELAAIHRLKEIEILPIVYTFDGLTTKRTKRALDVLKMNRREKAYLQSRIMKRTAEMINNEINTSITAEEEI